MTELNDNARALLDRVRGGFEATASDRARVRVAVQARTLSGGASASSAAPRFAMLGLGGGVLLLGLGMASIALWGSTPTPSSTHVPHAIVKPARHEEQATPIELVSAVMTVPVSEASTPESTLGITRPRHRPAVVEVTQEARAADPVDSLTEEMRLIQRARSAFRSNDFQTANRVLDEHFARFAEGMLVEEREALRVMCACKRSSEADEISTLETQFLRRFPNSSSIPSIRSVCDRR